MERRWHLDREELAGLICTVNFPPIEHGDRTPAAAKLGRQTDRRTDR